MSPQFVAPYVKSNKNDVNDADGIAEAVSTGKRAMDAPAGLAGVMAAARMEEGGGSNTGSPVGGAHTPTGTRRGAGRAGRVAEGNSMTWSPQPAGRWRRSWTKDLISRVQEPGIVSKAHVVQNFGPAFSRNVRRVEGLVAGRVNPEVVLLLSFPSDDPRRNNGGTGSSRCRRFIVG